METLPIVEKTEVAFISGIISDTNAIAQIASRVTPDMFENKGLGFVYQAALSLFNQGKKMDFNMLEDEMLRLDPDHYKKLNGLNFLEEGFSYLRDPENITEYAAQIKRYYQTRRLYGLFTELKLRCSDGSTDVIGLCSDAQKSIAEICEDSANNAAAQTLTEVAEERLNYFRNLRKNGASEVIYHTGFSEFDQISGGFMPGDLISIAGRPAQGKSAITLHMALNIARTGVPVTLFGLEMTSIQSAYRALASLGNIDPDNLRKSKLTDAEIAEMEHMVANVLPDIPLRLRFIPNARVEDICAETMMAVNRGECKMIFVDYIGLMHSPVKKNGTLDESIGENINALKALAMKAQIPVVVVSQMNRDVERRGDRAHMPMLADLRSSGVIEQTSDLIAFVYRPELHGITKDTDGTSLLGVGKLLVLKNRFGAPGHARFRFNRKFSKLFDYNPIQ